MSPHRPRADRKETCDFGSRLALDEESSDLRLSHSQIEFRCSLFNPSRSHVARGQGDLLAMSLIRRQGKRRIGRFLMRPILPFSPENVKLFSAKQTFELIAQFKVKLAP